MRLCLLSLCLFFAIYVLSLIADPIVIKPHEQWWEKNLDQKIQNFQAWIGKEDADSRKKIREYIKSYGYQRFLDIPCGLCNEYFGYKKDGINIEYFGVDITPKLVEMGKQLGLNVIQGSIEAIPYEDSYFDVSYARHILEHLDKPYQALNELIRVAKYEAIIIFFIKPINAPTKINLAMHSGSLLYHNRYNKADLEKNIQKNPKVSLVKWQDLNNKEIALHIYLKD